MKQEDIDFVKGYAERFLNFIDRKYKSQIKDIFEGKEVLEKDLLSDEDLRKYPGMGEVELFVYKFARDNKNLFIK